MARKATAKKAEKDVKKQVKETAVDVRNEAIEKSANLYALARKVLLAGLGAVALTAEEAQAFVDKLVERGEIAESEAQKLLDEFRKRAQERQKELSKRTEEVAERLTKVTEKPAKAATEVLEERISDVLQELNVPTKEDIDALAKKINQLSKKIDALAKQKQA